MAPTYPTKLFVLLVVLSAISLISADISSPPLTLDYYKSTCPRLLNIVRKEMECAVLSDPRNAAVIVRLHMHDCFVQVGPYSDIHFHFYLSNHAYYIIMLQVLW